ncbi:MAG: GGDEF domain-containing protein [Campylobacterota bacterium]|nr:GGDEF domain-containing protein [Campylobacterota bacterium]
MNTYNNKLAMNRFSLSSSSEVKSTIMKALILKKKHNILHISSFIHNTVLVQTLKKELEKEFPNCEISLLKHEDKNATLLTLFSSDESETDVPLSDIVISELHEDYLLKDRGAQKCRTQLFNTYFTDNLTSLPNLYQLRKDLEGDANRGLVLVKIDNFITINNFYGFVVGDFVIEEIAKYLQETLAPKQVYRLSGAEFAFGLEDHMNFYDLKAYLSELYEEIKSFYVLYQNSKIFIDFTMASTAGIEQNSIFSKVSMALNYAKDIGAPFWIYEDRMNFENDYERNFAVSEIVRNAVRDSKIVPYFQAIVDNKTGKIVKYECLARLIDANNNVLSPVLFIPLAKKIKVYNRVTKQMIDKSFAAFENSDFEFNINLSIEDIMSNEIYNYIIDKLKSTDASQRVTFELLESEAIKDFRKVEQFVSEVKRYGSKIAIDDFGSGYSNFSYLIKIKANFIKIDGSLIKDIDVDNSSLLVVETIVDFAKKLGMKTIAEYVHSSVVMDKVKELGIDYSQGFYIDEPSISREN